MDSGIDVAETSASTLARRSPQLYRDLTGYVENLISCEIGHMVREMGVVQYHFLRIFQKMHIADLGRKHTALIPRM